MFCSKCGSKVDDDAVICPVCGCAIKKVMLKEEEKPKKEYVYVSEKECSWFNVVGLIGFILSIVGWFITIFWIVPIAALVLSIVGVVLSNRYGYGLKGLSIAGIVVSAAALLFAFLCACL